MGIKVTGGRALRRGLRRMERGVPLESAAEAADEGAEVIRAEAARLAPRRTGFLSENIEKKVVVEGRTIRVMVGPEDDAFYGIFQELGTAHHPAQPFLRPAFDTKTDEALRAMQEHLRDETVDMVDGD